MRAIIVTAALFFTLTLVGCSGRGADPAPTPDSPGYTKSQVQRAITDYAREHNAFGGCFSSMLEYKGAGLWTCGSWTFNERSGAIVR